MKLKKVLIADDEKYVLERLKHIITWQNYGFTIVAQASNGKEALDYLSENLVDLMIVDVNMPIIDGLQLCKIMNESSQLRHIKVIILSGYAEFDYIHKALNCGVFDYLLKPINQDALISCIKKVSRKCNEEEERKRTEQKWKKDVLQYEMKKMREGILFFVTGRINKNEFYSIYRQNALFQTEANLWCICVRMEDCNELNDDYILWCNSLINIIEEMLLSFQIQYEFTIDNKDIILIIQSNSDKGTLYGRMQEIHEVILKITHINTIIGIGDRVQQYKELPNSYRSSIKALSNFGYSQLISRVIQYIQNHYMESELTLEKIASENFISYSYLSNIFKKETQQSIVNYIMEYRIEKAKDLILRQEFSIVQIADKTGFQDSKYFSKCFKKVTGFSPRDYSKYI